MATNRVPRTPALNLYCATALQHHHRGTIIKHCAISIVLALMVLSSSAVSAQTGIDFLKMGRDYTNLFYDGKSNEIWLHLSPEMKKVFDNPLVILGMNLQISGQYGAETAIVDERVDTLGESIVYQREVMFQKITTPVNIQWTFDINGIVTGFYMRTAAAAPSHFMNYKDKAVLRLPFKGNWLVTSGGQSLIENQHAVTMDQRFAYDLMVIKKGRTFSGDGSRPDQHFCFGQPVLAPGAGTVVEAKDGIPDNLINSPSLSPPEGNHVIIDHGNSEFSVLAHLKYGTLRVKVGDKVQPGTMIGRCGNSGNSPVPHLHIHLQNTPVLFKGEGLPIQFQDYLEDDKFMKSGEPERGQIIRNKRKK